MKHLAGFLKILKILSQDKGSCINIVTIPLIFKENCFVMSWQSFESKIQWNVISNIPVLPKTSHHSKSPIITNKCNTDWFQLPDLLALDAKCFSHNGYVNLKRPYMCVHTCINQENIQDQVTATATEA